MLRSRWALLALAGGALFLSGCGNWCENGWFSRFRTTSSTRDCPCDSFSAPMGMDGPLLTPPEGATTAPPTAPPPRIVPIPHASPIPYTPTSTGKLNGPKLP